MRPVSRYVGYRLTIVRRAIRQRIPSKHVCFTSLDGLDDRPCLDICLICIASLSFLLAGSYVLRLPFLYEFGSSRKYRTKSYGCTEMAIFSKTLNSTGSARNMKGIEMGRTLMPAGTGADMIG